jgi:hypothetical protein
MNHRKLRIAWSVTWGIVAVLLCVLWMRSYWWWDEIYYPRRTARCTIVTSVHGVFMLAANYPNSRYPDLQPKLWNQPAAKWYEETKSTPKPFLFVFAWDLFGFNAPHSVLIAITVTFSTLPWLSSRFSLRTLLLATSLVAVGLGMIMWTAH